MAIAATELRSPETSKSNRRVFIGFREGVLEAFGAEGLEQVGALLSPETRRLTVDNPLIDEWLPRRFLDEWFTAVWDGPAGGDQEKYEKFIKCMVEHGVNRFFRSLFRFLSPARFADAVVKQYRRDHSTGRLRAKIVGNSLQLNLYDLPFAPTPFLMMSTARSFHHGLALLDLPELRTDHNVAKDGSLEMLMTWKA